MNNKKIKTIPAKTEIPEFILIFFQMSPSYLFCLNVVNILWRLLYNNTMHTNNLSFLETKMLSSENEARSSTHWCWQDHMWQLRINYKISLLNSFSTYCNITFPIYADRINLFYSCLREFWWVLFELYIYSLLFT